MILIGKQLGATIALAHLALLAGAGSAWAVFPQTLEPAVDQAHLIFTGKIASRIYWEAPVQPDRAFRQTFTCFDIDVINTLKGEIVTDKMTLRFPGGDYSDGSGIMLSGYPPDYRIGESYLFFVEQGDSLYVKRLPIYITLELIEYAGNYPQQLLVDKLGFETRVVQGIEGGVFTYVSKAITRIVHHPGMPNTYEYSPELIMQAEPMQAADIVLEELREYIKTRMAEETYNEGEEFSALSVYDLPNLYAPEELADFSNWEGCGVRYDEVDGIRSD